MEKKRILKSQKGFTLIEIIAVLVILGILGAVAVPRYLDLTTNAKVQAAEGQVAEMKASLNLGYHDYFMANQAAPTGTQVITQLSQVSGTAFDVGTAPDIWNVTLTATGNAIAIAINSRGAGADLDNGYTASGSWNVPQ